MGFELVLLMLLNMNRQRYCHYAIVPDRIIYQENIKVVKKYKRRLAYKKFLVVIIRRRKSVQRP